MGESRERARELVLAHGWQATSYQILNPGIDYWFSDARAAVIGYTRRDQTLLAAGSPICAPEVLPEVSAEFEAFARALHCTVCYVCAEEPLRAGLADAGGYSAIAMGAQPAWDPRRWPQILANRPSLRAQLHRARNKGVEIEPIDPDEASRDPQLRRVLRQWVRGRSMPPLRFLTAPDVLDGEMRDRSVLVARRRGAAVALLVASPVPARSGYLVELLARSKAAPNGTSECLIDAAMRQFADAGCSYVTLGLVALAHAADSEMERNPAWLRPMMRFARAHANRFYNFRGLENFRLKMAPDRWECVYAISNEPSFSVRTLYALGGAFSGISPWTAIAIGAVKAVGAEAAAAVNWLRRAGSAVSAKSRSLLSSSS